MAEKICFQLCASGVSFHSSRVGTLRRRLLGLISAFGQGGEESEVSKLENYFPTPLCRRADECACGAMQLNDVEASNSICARSPHLLSPHNHSTFIRRHKRIPLQFTSAPPTRCRHMWRYKIIRRLRSIAFDAELFFFHQASKQTSFQFVCASSVHNDVNEYLSNAQLLRGWSLFRFCDLHALNIPIRTRNCAFPQLKGLSVQST